MSDREREEAAREQLAVREAVAARAHERPAPAFRARLKQEFTTGRFGAPRVPAPRPWFMRPTWLVPVAAGVIALTGWWTNRGPDWRVVGASGEGRVVVGSTSFELIERDAISAAIRRGGVVRTEGAVTLDLVAPGMMAVAMGPGSSVKLSAAPGRWWSRSAHAHVDSGNTYFSTGRAFRGAHLAVRTPEVEVDAVGTSFAVLRGADGSCVCVMEGHVHVTNRAGGGPEDVPEGMRRLVGADGSDQTLPILEDSVHRLHEQLSTTKGVLGR